MNSALFFFGVCVIFFFRIASKYFSFCFNYIPANSLFFVFYFLLFIYILYFYFKAYIVPFPYLTPFCLPLALISIENSTFPHATLVPILYSYYFSLLYCLKISLFSFSQLTFFPRFLQYSYFLSPFIKCGLLGVDIMVIAVLQLHSYLFTIFF